MYIDVIHYLRIIYVKFMSRSSWFFFSHLTSWAGVPTDRRRRVDVGGVSSCKVTAPTSFFYVFILCTGVTWPGNSYFRRGGNYVIGEWHVQVNGGM